MSRARPLPRGSLSSRSSPSSLANTCLTAFPNTLCTRQVARVVRQSPWG
jgi:hypothetical protein